MKTFLCILILFITSLTPKKTKAQNLVKDSSFEDFKECPNDLTSNSSNFSLKYWYIPTLATSDYFNSCSENLKSSMPNNTPGYQPARNGNGYIFLVFAKNWYEYIQTKLTTPLIKDKKYYVEFWASISDKYYKSSNSLGALISKEKIMRDFSAPLNYYEPQIISQTFIKDTVNWVKISGTFISKGNENYITIGCFSGAKGNFQLRRNPPTRSHSGYYIDDVLVEVYDKTIHDIIQLNKPIVMENIVFELGKSVLKESSFKELDKLSLELEKNSTINIKIFGYTDNLGQEKNNLTLSSLRAKAVAQYLITKGISKERIITKGYGSLNPISDNSTEAGRIKNRRVEFILTE
jgi:OmpA-OmpF porin, OOP family